MAQPPQMIFINLPTKNLEHSRSFYEAIGFKMNQQFSDATAACMVLSESIYVMLLTYDKWKQFTSKTIPDTKTNAQVLLCLSRDSRMAVERLAQTAEKAGGKMDPIPVQDFGFIYIRSFEDPDGHIWEASWVDMSAMPKG